MLHRISTGLAVGALIVSTALFLLSIGFDWGLQAADDERIKQQIVQEHRFSGYGRGSYEYLAGRYSIISFSILLFLGSCYVVNGLRNDRQTAIQGLKVIGLVLLLVPIYQYWWILSEKHLRSQTTYWNEPIDSLMRNSLPYEILCTFILMSLLMILSVSLVSHFFPEDCKFFRRNRVGEQPEDGQRLGL